MHRLLVRIQNLESENEQQIAKLVQKGDKVQSLKRSLLTMRAECCKLNSRLDAAERDNGHLRADLQKDAGEFDRMRDSMLGLRHRALDCGENMISSDSAEAEGCQIKGCAPCAECSAKWKFRASFVSAHPWAA